MGKNTIICKKNHKKKGRIFYQSQLQYSSRFVPDYMLCISKTLIAVTSKLSQNIYLHFIRLNFEGTDWGGVNRNTVQRWNVRKIIMGPCFPQKVENIRGAIQNTPEWCRHLYIKGIVHKEFVPTGQIVTSGFYCEVLWRLHENVRRHRTQLGREQTWLLHHDNAPSHTSVLTHQFLAKNKIDVPPPHHHTPLIWHPVTSSYFQNWNWSWKDAGLIPLRRSRPNRRECLTLWQKRTSRKRSKNGGDGGTGVYMREGNTWRVTAADRPYGEFYDFYSVSPENFGSTHVHQLL